MVIKELHNKIEENQKKMAEMMINLDILKEEYQNLMKELGLTAEELKSFANWAIYLALVRKTFI